MSKEVTRVVLKYTFGALGLRQNLRVLDFNRRSHRVLPALRVGEEGRVCETG